MQNLFGSRGMRQLGDWGVGWSGRLRLKPQADRRKYAEAYYLVMKLLAYVTTRLPDYATT